jgi:hypothetical protein
MSDNQLELEFYKNGSAKKVLQRYEFTSDEKRLINDAIRTAQKEKPRMLLIRKSDRLLREVAKTRKPISSKEDTKLDTGTIAEFDKYIKQEAQNTNYTKEVNSFLGLQRKSSKYMFVAILAVLVFSFLKTQGY